jgi:hypothetical protein
LVFEFIGGIGVNLDLKTEVKLDFFAFHLHGNFQWTSANRCRHSNLRAKQKEVKPMKKVPRNKFSLGSRRRKRGNSFSEHSGKSIFDLLLNIEARVRGNLGGQNREAVVRVPLRPNPSHTSRYVE